MTRDTFIASVFMDFERFNGSRSGRRRAPEDSSRLKNMAGRAWDLSQTGRSRASAKSAMKAEFFAWWNPILQIAWMLWGQAVIDWLLSKLFKEAR